MATKNSEIAAYTAMGGAAVGAYVLIGEGVGLRQESAKTLADSKSVVQTPTGFLTTNGPLTKIFVGDDATSGPFTVQVAGLGQPDQIGMSPVSLNIYYNGVLEDIASVLPSNCTTFEMNGDQLGVNVLQTFAGQDREWANIELVTHTQQYQTGTAVDSQMSDLAGTYGYIGNADIITGGILVVSIVAAAVTMKFNSIMKLMRGRKDTANEGQQK